MANDKQFGFLTPVVLFTGMNVERFITNPSTHIHITGLVPFNMVSEVLKTGFTSLNRV